MDSNDDLYQDDDLSQDSGYDLYEADNTSAKKNDDATAEREGDNELLKVVSSDDLHQAENTAVKKDDDATTEREESNQRLTVYGVWELMKPALTQVSSKRGDNESVLSEMLDMYMSNKFWEKRGQFAEKLLSKKIDSIIEEMKLLEEKDQIIGIWNQLHEHLSPNDNHRQVLKYRMKSELGKGGFGRVWMAHDEHSNICAVKMMKLHHSSNLVTDLTDILAEISYLQQSNHTNIPKYINSFMVHKEIWLVMEHIDGVNVHDLACQFKLNPAEIATICHGVLCALSHLHNMKIMHRDVKGRNIMVNNHGHVYLTDLGSSTLEGPHANTETGTQDFIAPEVHSAKHTQKAYCCNVDVWSLGITVVEIVAARPPYNRIPRHEVGRVIRETMPQAMTDFLVQCIEWDPVKRASASKLLEHEFLQTKETPEVLGDLVPYAKTPDLQSLIQLAANRNPFPFGERFLRIISRISDKNNTS